MGQQTKNCISKDFTEKLIKFSSEIEKCLENGFSVVIKANKDGSITVYRQDWKKIR